MNYKEAIDKVINYLKDTKAESSRVVWPNKTYITAATIVVFFVVLLVCLYVLLIDYGFAKIFGVLGHGRLR